eukprot:jgi/Ulvmu1/5974/UM026_0098.1
MLRGLNARPYESVRIALTAAPSRFVSTAVYNLWSWGRGSEGALADGTGSEAATPRHSGHSWEAERPPDVRSGMWHSGCIVDGQVYMWGKGSLGRLGVGDEASEYEPTHVPFAGSVMSLALGGQHSLAVSDPGKSAGHSKHILPEDHQVYSDSETPETTPSPGSSADFQPSDHIGHYLVNSWGMGDFGCLGQQHFTSQLQPTPVQTFEALTTQSQDPLPIINSVPAIAAAGAHSLLLDRFGRVFSCGRDDGDGRLGLQVPALESSNVLPGFHQVALPEATVQVAAGGYMSFALTAAGRLFAWGSNGNGEQGSGPWSWSGPRPNLVHALSDGRVKQVAAGGFHGAAVSHEGEVYTWGMGRHGALGHGETSNCPSPSRVHALRGVVIDHVVCGPTATLAVSREGDLYAWGNNACGMLGVGPPDLVGHTILSPTLAKDVPPVASVAVGAMHGLAFCRAQN